jgi:hypothetical protein
LSAPTRTYFQLWCCSGDVDRAAGGALGGVVVAQHLVDGEDIQRAAGVDRRRLRELLGEHLVRALAAFVADFVDAADAARADPHPGLVVVQRHGARADKARGPDFGLEALRQLHLVDRNLCGRRLGHLAGNRRELGVGQRGRLALVPGRRGLGFVLRERGLHGKCEHGGGRERESIFIH